MAKKDEKKDAFASTVEDSLTNLLKGNLTNDEKIRALAVAVRWAAVKDKINLDDDGSGFEE